MEQHLATRDYFVGGRLSLADLALFAYTHRADEGGFDLAAFPAVRAWLDRCRGPARRQRDARAMSELAQLRLLARANRLANHRLHAACLQLSDAEFTAPRTSFFPSLWATLNHILIVDWYYIAALYREADMRKAFASETPFDRMPELAAAQATSDAAADRLVRRRRRRGAGRRSRDAAFDLRAARRGAVTC